MIKIKTFPISESEEANEFMEKFPPRSTEKQSGLVFHNGSIVVIYEDGVENPEDEKGKVRGEIAGDRSKLMLTRHSLEEAKAALIEEKKLFTKMAPKGYKTGMKFGDIKKLFGEFTPQETIQEFMDAVQVVEQRMENLENEILMDNHEVKRISASIKGWEALL